MNNYNDFYVGILRLGANQFRLIIRHESSSEGIRISWQSPYEIFLFRHIDFSNSDSTLRYYEISDGQLKNLICEQVFSLIRDFNKQNLEIPQPNGSYVGFRLDVPAENPYTIRFTWLPDAFCKKSTPNEVCLANFALYKKRCSVLYNIIKLVNI